MPKIINAYAPDDTVTSSLKALADSFFGGDQLKNELYRQKAKGLIRENENLPLAADALARGDVPAAIRFSVLSGLKGDNVANYGLYGTSNRVTDIEDPALSRAVVGAGKSAASSPWGVRQAENNRLAIENERTRRMAETERFKVDNTPELTIDPATGQPTITRRSDAFGRRPVLENSKEKGVAAARLQAQPGGLSAASPADKKFVDALPPEGSQPFNVVVGGKNYLTTNGLTDIYGTPIPPGGHRAGVQGDVAGTGIRPSVQGDLQSADIARTRFKSLLNYTRGIAEKDPTLFGVTGQIRDLAQQGVQLAGNVAQLFGAADIREAQKKVLQTAAAAGVNPAILTDLFDPNLPAIVAASNLLVYQGAAAIAGQKGREVSDKDIALMKHTFGDPRSFMESRESFLTRLSTAEQIVDLLAQADKNFAPNKEPGTPQSQPAPGGAPAAAPTGNPVYDINGNPVR